MPSFSLDQLRSTDRLVEWIVPVAYKVLLAILIFYIGRALVRALVHVLTRGMRRAQADETLIGFLNRVLRTIGVALVLLAALGELGIDTTSAAAVLGGAALAIGLALQNQLASFAAGVLLIVFRPIRVGEWIEAGGKTGQVIEVNIFSTVLVNLENQRLYLPNAKVWGDTITNYSRLPWRRLDLTISVDYEADLRKARAILEELIANEPRILKEPAPVVAVRSLNTSSIDLAVRICVNIDCWWDVQCALYERTKLRFDAEGVEIPYPKMDLKLRGDAAVLRGSV